MESKTPLWEFVDVTKAYPGVLANDEICIKLMPRSIHGLLGENGCGKSTMIKTLAGVQHPDSGKILQGRGPNAVRASTWAKAFLPENLSMVSAEIVPIIEASEMGWGLSFSPLQAIKEIRAITLQKVVLITRSV